MQARFLAAAAIAAALVMPPPASAAGQRVKVTGELVDTWCAVTGIMFALGTAHHQCAVWCAVGGIPISIRDAKGEFYMILRVGDDDMTVANPRMVRIQSHEVTVDGDLLERDGVKYLLVEAVADDKGVVNLTHEANGVQPFGH